MNSRRRRPITRRQLLGGGALVAAGAVGGGYGRYAIGDEFDEHVAGLLGVPVATATSLTRAARAREGGVDWELHRGAFVVATTWPGRWALPGSVREKAIQTMVDLLVGSTGHELAYVGLREVPSTRGCAGLVRR